MRIGIFGGTFDPVHYGHLLLAESCREQRALDQVWFVPAAVAPHKQTDVRTPGEHRARMLELAVAGDDAFRVSRIELERGGVSYTAETLRVIHTENPAAELFLLLGADSLADLPTWRAPDEICRLAIPLVVTRPGVSGVDFQVLSDFVEPSQIEGFRKQQVEMPLIDLSSTAIRRRAAAGQSIRYQTPSEVAAYIAEHELYGE